MALTTKRIIALPSQTDPQEGDYLAIDNAQGGTHKIPVGRIGAEVDDTLTEAGKAADAKATGDALEAEQTARQQADEAEAQAREAADNAFEGQVGDLKSEITKVALDAINVLEGKIVGFLNSSGNFSPLATIYSHTDFIKVNAGDEFKYKLKSASASASIIAFYSSPTPSAFVSNVASNGGEQSGTYTVPSDGYIVVGWINSFESDLYFYKSNFVPAVITETAKSLIDAPVSDVYKKVYSIKNDGITNGFINGAGDFSANAIYRTSAFLPIKSGESFEYKLSHGTTLPIISFYNSNKAYDSAKSVIGVSGYSTGTYTASADGYIRFTYLDSRNDVYVLFTEIIPDNVLRAFPTNEVPQMNILVLGDSIMGEDDDITNPLSVLSGASVINGAVGGTRASNRGGSDNFQYFDGVNLIQALCTNTWAAQETAVEALKTSYPWFPAKLAVLEDVDMSSVDMILFNWATNDYTAAVSMADIVSAHNIIINTIQTYYPQIRIIIVSPIWRFFDTEQDNKNADNFAFNVNTLKEISNAIVDNAHDKRITVFDAYKNMPLNYKTASLYFNSGSDVHLNAVGGKLFAHYLNGFINSIC